MSWVWVKVSTELLEEMGEWSEPVEVRITKAGDSPLGPAIDMEIRKANLHREADAGG